MCAPMGLTGLIPGRISTTDFGRLVTLRTVASIANDAQPEDGLRQPLLTIEDEQLRMKPCVRGLCASQWYRRERWIMRIATE